MALCRWIKVECNYAHPFSAAEKLLYCMCSLNTGSSTGCQGACRSVSVYCVGAHAPVCIFLCTHFRGRETCMLMNFAIDSRRSINMQPVHFLPISTHGSLCDWSRNVLFNVVYKCAIACSKEAQNLTYFVLYVQLVQWELQLRSREEIRPIQVLKIQTSWRFD